MNAVAELPPLIASRYVPIRPIAKGGMGAVYEVEHARTGERLALKVLLAGVGASTEAQERFKREARASARIKSEHVVRVTDADVAPELGGAPFLVMELLQGADLERHTTGFRPDAAIVVGWLRQVAGVIDRAHRLGIIHRDLKPENLFLCQRESGPPLVKVLDFGIIKLAEERTAASQEGRILGTPQYMAPEQLATDEEITPAVDRYALGLVAYRLLTSHNYYRGDVMSILAQKLHQPLLTPSERQAADEQPALPAAFDGWFLKACHREPEKRFASAQEQTEALAEALGLARAAPDLASAPTLNSEPVTAPSPSGVSPPAPRRARAVAVAAIALLAAGAAAVAYLSRATTERSQTPAAPVTAAGPVPAAIGSPSPPPPPAPVPPAPTAPEVAPAKELPPPPAEASKGPRPRRPGAHHPPAAPAVSGAAPATPDPYADQK